MVTQNTLMLEKNGCWFNNISVIFILHIFLCVLCRHASYVVGVGWLLHMVGGPIIKTLNSEITLHGSCMVAFMPMLCEWQRSSKVKRHYHIFYYIALYFSAFNAYGPLKNPELGGGVISCLTSCWVVTVRLGVLYVWCGGTSEVLKWGKIS